MESQAMVFNRFAAALSLLLAAGCAPEPPTPEAVSQELLKKILPSVSTAETVTVVASSPTSADTPTDFAVTVADELAERIGSGGLAQGAQPKVHVQRTFNDLKAGDPSDITIYFRVNVYDLSGEFAADRVVISKRFKADAWIDARGTDTTFSMDTGFDTNEKGTGPETEATPTWESFGYSNEPSERQQVFAGECAESILKTFHGLSSQLGQSK